MEKNVIHKNKGELFKCNLKIDGAEIKDTVVRLCLEFSDNKNLFFYGKLNEDGSCTIPIPKLKEIESREGKMIVEAMADSMYFRLYESEVELRNAVEVNFSKPEVMRETTIKLEGVGPIRQETPRLETKPTKNEAPKVEARKEEPDLSDGRARFKDFLKRRHGK